MNTLASSARPRGQYSTRPGLPQVVGEEVSRTDRGSGLCCPQPTAIARIWDRLLDIGCAEGFLRQLRGTCHFAAPFGPGGAAIYRRTCGHVCLTFTVDSAYSHALSSAFVAPSWRNRQSCALPDWTGQGPHTSCLYLQRQIHAVPSSHGFSTRRALRLPAPGAYTALAPLHLCPPPH